jgi:hypothetical protein
VASDVLAVPVPFRHVPVHLLLNKRHKHA